ncbi:MAG: hypothetical protein EBZ77_13800, partial [Chitinophagia bacterium]|nr:hypothetical protein [Chitinophagia bacterium]
MTHFLAGAIRNEFQRLGDPATFNDVGSAVLVAIANHEYAKANEAAMDADRKQLPLEAVNKMLDVAYQNYGVKDPAAAPPEFAGAATLKFVTDADMTIAAGSQLGSGSSLTGLLPQGALTLGAGITLKQDTYVPAWTLFKKSANAEYWNNAVGKGLEVAKDAVGRPTRAITPFGGQWVLAANDGNQNKFKVAGADLVMNDPTNGIKITEDRKIFSDIKVATADQNKYIVSLLSDTRLPAGTKFRNYNGAGANLVEDWSNKIFDLGKVLANPAAIAAVPVNPAVIADGATAAILAKVAAGYNFLAAAGNASIAAVLALPAHAAAGDPAIAALNFAPLVPGGEVALAHESIVVGQPSYSLPDNLSIEFPAFPTEVNDGFGLPAGTRVTALGAPRNFDAIVKDAANAFFNNSAGVASLNGLPMNESFVLPVDGKIVSAAAPALQVINPAEMQITNHPLYTPGIISGVVQLQPNASGLTYKVPVDFKLQKNYTQNLHAGSVLQANTEFNPGLHVAANDWTRINSGVTVYDGVLKKESYLAPGTAINKNKVAVGAAPMVFGQGWAYG